MVSVIDTRWKWQTKFATVTALWVALATLHFASAFDITNMTPLANGNLRNGNKVLNANGNLYGERQAAMANYGSENENEYADGDDGGNDDDGNGDDDIDDDDNTDGKVHNDSILDDNEIPIRYDEAQLWRIYNISDAMRHANQMPLADILENRYGGTIWKENSKFLDISFTREHLKEARGFLDKHNLKADVLNSNIQELIDNETMMGINMTQSEKGQRTKKAARSGINWKDYHDLETIYAFMREIRGKFPNICRLYTIGKTAEGRDLKVLRISENPRDYKKIWIDGGIHAREWVSPATVTFILYQLMSKWQEQPDYIRQKTWYIMPVMNPDGYAYSRSVNRLWRKNRSPAKRSTCLGVDLNRNFDIGWSGYGSSTNPCSDTYRGASPASELETSAVATFLSKRKYNLESYLTFHSYGQLVVYPWAYKAVKVRDAPVLQRVANIIVQRIQKKTGKVYRAAVTHEVLGIAGGGSDDWARAALGTQYVYTIELRDRGEYGFLLPPNQILETAVEGYMVVDTIAQNIKISENPSEYKKIWIDGGVHAREWITPATVTYILKRLMSNWEELPNYLSNKTWYFMPMVNPDGYEYSRRVDRLWRKNRSPNKHSKCKGVDINRNFNIGWNTQGSSANPCRETYHGPAPMSELETEAIVTFLKERKSNLEAFLTFHSYGQMILYPWGHKSSTLKSAPLLQGLGNKVAQLMRKATGKYYQVGNRHKLLPPAGGGADDWACSTLGTTFMYTIELRDRGNYGFVLPARQILGTAVEGYIMVDVVAQHIQ